MKIFLCFLVLFIVPSAFAADQNPPYFLMGRGLSSPGGTNTVFNPHSDKPIYRIYIRNKGTKTANIGWFRIYSNKALFRQSSYGVSAIPGYGLFLVIDAEKATSVDRVDFDMTGPSQMYEIYGITIPNYRY
jgi:hypothetical protein